MQWQEEELVLQGGGMAAGRGWVGDVGGGCDDFFFRVETSGGGPVVAAKRWREEGEY